MQNETKSSDLKMKRTDSKIKDKYNLFILTLSETLNKISQWVLTKQK